MAKIRLAVATVVMLGVGLVAGQVGAAPAKKVTFKEWTAEHKSNLKRLVATVTNLAGLATAGDASGALAACATLSSELKRDRKLPGPPAAKADWKEALNQLGIFASDCTTSGGTSFGGIGKASPVHKGSYDLGVFIAAMENNGIKLGTSLAAEVKAADNKVKTTKTTSKTPATTTSPPTTTAPTTTTAPPTEQEENAVRAAKQYLSNGAFSEQGLITQLDSQYGTKYPIADATAAVESLNVTWNAEAEKSAKQYLSNEAFSCTGLITQLDSQYGTKYTVTQATYGAQQAGAC